MPKTPNDPGRHIYDWERLSLDDEVHRSLLRETYSPLQHKRAVDYFKAIFNFLTWWKK